MPDPRASTSSWLLALSCACSGCGGDGGGDGEGGSTAGASTTLATTQAGSEGEADSTAGEAASTGRVSADSGGSRGGGSTSTADTSAGVTTGSTTGDTATGDSSDSGGGDSTGAEAQCGDAIRDPGEACDDGNRVDSDGCNNDCTVSGSVLWTHSQSSGSGQNDDAFAIVVDDEGRATIAGEFFGTSNLDLWVRQYQDDGLVWTQVFDAATGNDGARALAQAGETLYAAGYVNIPGQSNNVRIQALGIDGTPGLALNYNDPVNGADVGAGVATDPAGNVVVAGYEAVAMQGSNVWVREYTPAGGVAWTAGYGGPALSTDRANDVAVDAAGNVAVVGYHTVLDQGRDIWIRYYDTDGGEGWTATYGSLDALDDEAHGVAFDPEGNVVVAGFELDPVIPWRAWLAKYDAAGRELWTQTWEGDTGEGGRAFGVTVDDVGDIVLVGQTRDGELSLLTARKVDTDGNERWVTTIEGAPGTTGVGRDVAIGPQRRVWIAGGIDLGVDARDIFIARLAP